MGKWICDIDKSEYEDVEKARDVAIEYVDDMDLVDQISAVTSGLEIVEELRRLESPLYFTLLEAALDEVLKDYFYEEEEEEDEQAL